MATMVYDQRESQIENEIIELEKQIKTLETLIVRLKKDLEHQHLRLLRLQLHRERVKDSGIKY